ncbi:hypothetical protein TcasGA2_TC031012 [Tribolium castaneum]|uniref:Reverse transcriptase domain-containing protein n=1 Tax=Tribolium castaneum TaxID=7070 RepID=A0A139W9B7_TRICA|nr:hypothetical protein TcasGA2_TC031012 [Tribolium castaneum]
MPSGIGRKSEKRIEFRSSELPKPTATTSKPTELEPEMNFKDLFQSPPAKKTPRTLPPSPSGGRHRNRDIRRSRPICPSQESQPRRSPPERPPPPIVIHAKTKNHSALLQFCKRQARENFTIKLKEKMEQDELEYHTYTTREDKTHAFVLHGLDKGTGIADLEAEMQEKGKTKKRAANPPPTTQSQPLSPTAAFHWPALPPSTTGGLESTTAPAAPPNPKERSQQLKPSRSSHRRAKVKHKINLKDETPIHTKTYRYPHIHKTEVQNKISKMLKQGIIRPSDSPWSSPIWIVPKKLDASGQRKWRIVIDYRKLNEQTVEDRYPLPNINDILDKLGRSQYFSTIDLASGFHQVEQTSFLWIKTFFTCSCNNILLTTDASNYAIGAVLSQGTIGSDLLVAFASRTLNEHEVNYSTIEKELLAIVWATKYFRPY